jgi:hypothetical protein
MGPISMLFPNPAVKILEEHLWEDARKRYLVAHPTDQKNDARTVMRKVRTAYKDAVAATLKDADQKVRATWGQFKHGMTDELRTALATVLRMSDVDWYSVEIGPPDTPSVIAAPYELLKQVTTGLLFRFLRKEIQFENLDDETLEALASYAADEKFLDLLESACHNYDAFQIGGRSDRFVVVEIVHGDAYFLGEERHHSLIDMVILSSTGASASNRSKHIQKAVARKWLHQDRKNRNDDRRFTSDGWEIEFEHLKSWATEP